jgi:hypothetical protein
MTKAMRIVLHIGQQKTGSTAIQYALTRAHDELAKHGVLYPLIRPRNDLGEPSRHRLLGIGDFGPKFTASTLLAQPQYGTDQATAFSRFREHMERQIAEAKPELLVLSTETFFRPLIPGPMCAWLRPYPCEVVAYIRTGDPRGVVDSYRAAFEHVTVLPYNRADSVADFSRRFLPIELVGTRENVTS